MFIVKIFKISDNEENSEFIWTLFFATIWSLIDQSEFYRIYLAVFFEIRIIIILYYVFIKKNCKKY